MSSRLAVLMLLAGVCCGSPARGQTAADAKDQPLARTEAGAYELEIRTIGKADPQSFRPEFVPKLSIPKPSPEDLAGERQTIRKKTGKGAAVGETLTGGFGSGSGGSATGKFTAPNLVLGVRVLSRKDQKTVSDCCISAGYRLTDGEGTKSEATFGSEFRARYPLEDADLVPLPVYVPSISSGAIRDLEATLIITPQTTDTVAFTPDELRRKARKSAGKRAVQIESVGKNGDKIELVLSVSEAAPQPAPNAGFGDLAALASAMLERQVGTSIDVYVEDSSGKQHQPSAKNAQSSGGGSGGSSSAGVSVNGERTSTRRKPNSAAPSQKLTYSFDPLPESVSTKKVVCVVRTPTGETLEVPFRFSEIPLKTP